MTLTNKYLKTQRDVTECVVPIKPGGIGFGGMGIGLGGFGTLSNIDSFVPKGFHNTPTGDKPHAACPSRPRWESQEA